MIEAQGKREHLKALAILLKSAARPELTAASAGAATAPATVTTARAAAAGTTPATPACAVPSGALAPAAPRVPCRKNSSGADGSEA